MIGTIRDEQRGYRVGKSDQIDLRGMSRANLSRVKENGEKRGGEE